MKYVALLRGINIGGNNKIEMQRLKQTFEELGFTDVSTYINSGNVFFSTNETSPNTLASTIEQAIVQDFALQIPVLVRNAQQIAQTAEAMPVAWQNDKETKCDVLFLWEAIDTQTLLDELKPTRVVDEVIYTPGALLWRVHRKQYGKSALSKLAGSKPYKQMTVRNCNTLRKLAERMS